MRPTPILEMARAYGLRPRLWLLAGSSSTDVLSIDSEKRQVDFDVPSDRRIETEFIRTSFRQICPATQVNELHILYDNHHKVSFFLKSHQIKTHIILSLSPPQRLKGFFFGWEGSAE